MIGPRAPQAIVDTYAEMVRDLVGRALEMGVVIEVTLQPRQPLQMGNYAPVVQARAAWSNHA